MTTSSRGIMTRCSISARPSATATIVHLMQVLMERLRALVPRPRRHLAAERRYELGVRAGDAISHRTPSGGGVRRRLDFPNRTAARSLGHGRKPHRWSIDFAS